MKELFLCALGMVVLEVGVYMAVYAVSGQKAAVATVAAVAISLCFWQGGRGALWHSWC